MDIEARIKSLRKQIDEANYYHTKDNQRLQIISMIDWCVS